MATSALRVVSAEGAALASIMDATYEIWHEGLSREAYRRWYEAQLGTAWGRAHLRRFALTTGGDVTGDEVLASAKEYTLAASLDNQPVSIVGLGAVFTQPRARGRGYARELIDRLLARAAAEGIDYALLFSEIGADYYRQFGFDAIATEEHVLQVAESPRGAPAVLVRAADERDLPAIAEMGRIRAGSYRFHLERDVDIIQYAIAKKRLLAGLGPPGARQVLFFVVEEGRSAVAYVVITARATDWVLEECGDRDPSGARVGAILQALIARQPVGERPAIRGRLPAGFLPPQITIAESRPTSDVMMIRPLAGAPISPPLCQDDVLYWLSDVF